VTDPISTTAANARNRPISMFRVMTSPIIMDRYAIDEIHLLN
jgi:hypothetical protein